jgi:hypothetical protein
VKEWETTEKPRNQDPAGPGHGKLGKRKRKKRKKAKQIRNHRNRKPDNQGKPTQDDRAGKTLKQNRATKKNQPTPCRAGKLGKNQENLSQSVSGNPGNGENNSRRARIEKPINTKKNWPPQTRKVGGEFQEKPIQTHQTSKKTWSVAHQETRPTGNRTRPIHSTQPHAVLSTNHEKANGLGADSPLAMDHESC